jgi:hypothetical protein
LVGESPEQSGMTATFVRVAILLTVVATVAIRYQSAISRDALEGSFDIGGAIETLLRDHNLALRENPIKPPRLLSHVVYFQRPQCARSSVVMPLSLNHEALPYLHRVVTEGYSYRFIYLDGTWPGQARLPMLVEWLRHAVLNVVGASRYLPVKTAVVLADPVDCTINASIDWRLLWDKAWNEQRKISRGERRDTTGEAAKSARFHS